MTKIVFIDYAGAETVVDATNGESVMEAAINNNIEGIVADDVRGDLFGLDKRVVNAFQP